jgi:hypothetical protein
VRDDKVYASIHGGTVYQFILSFLEDKVVLESIAKCHSPASVFIVMNVINNALYSYTCDGAWSVAHMMVSASWGIFIQKMLLAPIRVERKDRADVPANFSLQQNYPNPFNPVTTIAFDVSEKGRVVLKIFDTLGHEVATLADGEYLPGSYKTEFNADNLPSGVYFCRMRTKNCCELRKLVLMR